MEYHIYDIPYIKESHFMTPLDLFKCLSEDTRLKSSLLISANGELCVCDLTSVLNLSQPKVSRHLAELRKCGILQDQRRGKWVYYKLPPDLPDWAKTILQTAAASESKFITSTKQFICTQIAERNACC